MAPQELDPGALPRFPLPGEAYNALCNQIDVRNEAQARNKSEGRFVLGLHATPGKPKTRVVRLGAAPEHFRDLEFLRLTMADGRVFDEAIRPPGDLEGAAQRMVGRLDAAA